MPPTNDSSAAHSQNLDILRAIAVMLVLVDHILETIGHKADLSFHPVDWQLGRVGVLLFFVHTSLVLMQSLARLHRDSSAPVQAFVIKRILRIYPLSVTCVLAVYFLEIPPLPFAEFRPIDLGTLASNLGLTMNLLGSQLVLSPLWSLPIELQMYVTLPFLYATVASHPLGRRAAMAWGIAVALALLQPALSERLNVLFFAPCFMAGIVAYMLLGIVRAPFRGRFWIPYVLALVGGYLLVETALPGVHNPAPQWLLCLAVGLGIPLFRGVQSPLINRLGATIAKYSYGVYLFHCIALWIGCYVFADWPWPAQWMTAALVLVALCAGCYHGIEKPGIDLGARLSRRYEASRRVPARRST